MAIPRFGSAVLPEFAQFVRDHWLKLSAISALLLAPCFWHREISASDLGSHLYNAWLAQLIHHGQAPGLWIAPQHTNVLFDLLLSGLGELFGLHAAEKIAVPVCVLIFFWGTFALVAAASRRAPWFLVPCIALFTYGWTFEVGFFNYYLSLGLSFFTLAIVWRGKSWDLLIAVVLALVTFVAHPLGFVWLLAASAYLLTAELVQRPRYQLALFLGGAALLVAFHLYLWRHYNADRGAGPPYAFNGFDQLRLFGPRYAFPEFALLALALIFLAADLIRRRREPALWRIYLIPLQLYVLIELSVYLLPEGIHFPPPRVTLALLTERLTSVSAALICCLLGAMQPRRWHLIGTAVIAAVFFSFLYQDTATVNRMEQQAVRLVSALPPDQRVMATILPAKGSRVMIQHIIDRACIARCFSYGNYEPSTGLFRVHALPGNPYVLTDYNLATDMENGEYTVQPDDLPVYQVYQCSVSGTDLCIRALQAGEDNDRLGVHPDRDE